ncbi:MAG: hypothetical protein WC538_04015 [Thermoanaerobaculia bacterium]|jgi:Cu(I)/Ag(I) efflux system membrane fusion protein
MQSTIVIPVILMLAACGGDHAAHKAGEPAKTPGTSPAAAAPVTTTAEALSSLPEASRVPFGAMMAGYDSIHAALASDKTDGVAGGATALAGAARLLQTSATEPSKTFYLAIATEADDLAANAGDITKARQQFGELNKGMISLLVANPDLAKGRVVVECPMTKNYRKWLQTDEKVRNPHYGSTMLECGTISKLEL